MLKKPEDKKQLGDFFGMSNSYAECYPAPYVRIFLFFFFNNNRHIAVYLFLINFIFGYAGSFCCVWVFSSCDERGLLSSCSSFSCCGAQVQ